METKTPFTVELAEKYGFKCCNVYGCEYYAKSITPIMYFDFPFPNKECLLCVRGKDLKITIPCYLENIKAVYFGLTGKELKPIKK